VRAFLADGTELGVLDAQGAWRVVPHNLKLRQEIRKQKDRRRGRQLADANPIEAYVQEKLAQARKTRKAATELAHTVRLLASAPTARTPVGPRNARAAEAPLSPETAPTVVAPASTLAESAPRVSVRPKKLSVGTGQVF
jgi:putative transposase